MEEKKTNQIKAKEAKPTLAKRFKDTFVVEDFKEVLKSVKERYVVPTIKKGFFEAFTGGMAMWLGVDKESAPKPNVASANVSYRSYYDRNRQDANPFYAKPRYSVRDMTFETEEMANDVLEHMKAIISTDRVVNVAKYLDLCGRGDLIAFTDHNWGWSNLQGVRAVPASDGWHLTLPRVEALD